MRPVKAVQFRKLKSIDFASFCNDLSRSSLFASPVTDCQEAVIEYNATLSSVLDDHAPLIRRCFTVRPDNPWDSEEIHSSRRCVRRSERGWKRTKLTIDKEIILLGLQELHNMINKAKTTFLESQIHDSSRKKVSLFRLIDSLLLPKHFLRMPAHPSLTELVERFSDFFVSKMLKMRGISMLQMVYGFLRYACLLSLLCPLLLFLLMMWCL
jgi:hypothetical protein